MDALLRSAPSPHATLNRNFHSVVTQLNSLIGQSCNIGFLLNGEGLCSTKSHLLPWNSGYAHSIWHRKRNSIFVQFSTLFIRMRSGGTSLIVIPSLSFGRAVAVALYLVSSRSRTSDVCLSN